MYVPTFARTDVATSSVFVGVTKFVVNTPGSGAVFVAVSIMSNT